MKLFKKLPEEFNCAGIYKITCKNHSYIGSSLHIKSRLLQHKSKLNKENHYNTFFQRVYDKYGKDDFTVEILEKIENATTKIIQTREEYYIKHLSPDINLTKVCSLGNNSDVFRKTVYQYTLEGEFVAEHVSTAQASRDTGILAIQHAANSEMTKYKSAGGFLWSYSKSDKLNYTNNSNKSRIKTIYYYDLFGNYLGSFESAAECVRNLFGTDNLSADAAMVSSVCKGKQCSFKGYRFSQEKFEKLPFPKNKRGLPIIQMTQNLEFIKIWENTVEIFKNLGISKKELNQCLSSQRKDGNPRSCGGFKWKRLAP